MDTFDLTKDPADAIPIAGRPDPRQSDCQGDGGQLRRPGMPLLRAHARGAVSCNARSLQGPGAVRLQGRSADRPASLGDARSRGRQLPGGAERRMFTGPTWIICTHTERRSQATTATLQRALPRWIALRGRRPRWANSTRPQLNACMAKQDETQIQGVNEAGRDPGI